MTTRTNLLIAVAFLAMGVAGCQQPQRRPVDITFEEQTITIDSLALRLGLRVGERDDTFVVLKDPANTVLIFMHADGRIFVNGKPIGSVGTVRKEGRTLYVPEMLASQIRPHLRRGTVEPPRPPRRTTGLVVIDAGHGGRDPGTTSPGGIQEKNLNLRVAAKIARRLERRGIGVKMTRWQDQYIELEERAAIANRRNADLFVSIHADSAPSRDARGFTIYIADGASSATRRAAQAISRSMAGTGLDNRGIREAEYRVLVRTKGPAVLVEMGYLSNPQDARLLANDTFRDRIADAITDGILAYLR